MSNDKNFAFNATAWELFVQLLKMIVAIGLAIGVLYLLFVLTRYVVIDVRSSVGLAIALLYLVYLGAPIAVCYFAMIWFFKWLISHVTYGSSKTQLELTYESKNTFFKNMGKFILKSIGLIAMSIGAAAAIAYIASDRRNDFGDAFNVILVVVNVLIIFANICLIWAILFKEIIENTEMNGRKFVFKNSVIKYAAYLFVDIALSFIPIVLTLGIYSIWVFVRIIRKTVASVEYSGKQVRVNDDFNVKNVFYMFLFTGLLSMFSGGLLMPWRFVKDTDELMGYTYLSNK